jgi:tryptophan 2,3-dioxygenase
MEILAGLREDLRVDFEGIPYEANLAPADQEHLTRVRSEMTLRDALLDWLSRTPIDRVFPSFAEAFLGAFAAYAEEQARLQDANPNLAPSQRRAARARLLGQVEEARNYLLGGDEAQNRAHQAFIFIASYRDEPLLRWPSTLIDALIEFEECFRIFRFRHARMVERMIGSRTGTGGSPGVAYLDRTTSRYKIFGDLLEARNFLLASSRVPKLPDNRLLHFRFEGTEP